MKANEYFIDVSAYQPADLGYTTQASGTSNTIIKVTEGTGWVSPYKDAQASTSNPIGYYHFARFGGNVNQAIAEATHCLNNVGNKKVNYIVCDYEDSASANMQANTNAIIAFMDTCKSYGYQPIYYSYKPYTLANVAYQQILTKYPDSLWMAAYPSYNVTPDPVWSIFPALDGIRWWQFTSTGISGGLDKNVVLIDDNVHTAPKTTVKIEDYTEDEDMFVFTANSDLGSVNNDFKKFGKGATFLIIPSRAKIRYVGTSDERNWLLKTKKIEEFKGGPADMFRCLTLFDLKF